MTFLYFNVLIICCYIILYLLFLPLASLQTRMSLACLPVCAGSPLAPTPRNNIFMRDLRRRSARWNVQDWVLFSKQGRDFAFSGACCLTKVALSAVGTKTLTIPDELHLTIRMRSLPPAVQLHQNIDRLTQMMDLSPQRCQGGQL